MATYKYRQNLSEGASAGYVEYNITPDFGSVMALGDSFEISGRVYCGDMKRYGIAAEAALASGGFGIELGRVEMTVSKGKSAAFSMQCYASYLLEEAAGERGFSAYLSFMLPENADFSAGAYTAKSEAQKLSLLKERLAPVISGVTFADSTGAYDRFGGAVQGKSDLSAALDITLDPLDPSLYIETARLAFGGNTIDIPAGNISGNVLYIGIPQFSGAFAGFSVIAVDSKGNAGSYAGGAFAVYPYAPPKLYAFEGKDLVERYEVNTDDAGNETAQASDSGQYLWASFTADVTPINGKNRWEIIRRYAQQGSEPANEAVADAFADGKSIRIYEDQDIFPRSISFSANARWTVEIEIRDFFESTVLRFDVDKAGGYFNIEKYGVAAGMRSTAAANEPKFESAYPVYPYQGIARCPDAVAEIHLALEAKFKLYKETNPLCLMQYGNMVLLQGEITPAAAISGNATEHIIADLPEGFAPKYSQTWLCQGTGAALWMLRAYAAGDENYPSKLTFGRYRSGGSYASCAAGNWLPVSASWVCGGTIVQDDGEKVELTVSTDGAAVITGTELSVNADGGANIDEKYLKLTADGAAVIG